MARGRALLVEYRAAGIVDDAPALFADAYRPVQLLVIEEVDLRHRSGFFERFAPDHHRRAVRIGRVVRGVVPPVVGFPEADQGVAQRDARQGRVARELNMLRRSEKPDFRTDRADRAVVVEGFAEVVQGVLGDFGVVVQQQQIIARRRRESEVVAAGEP